MKSIYKKSLNLLSRIINKLKRILLSLIANMKKEFYCPVCKRYIFSFLPIDNFFQDNLKQYGFKYSFDDFETLNLKQYTCPSCNSSDRDRLYALYIEKIFENKELDTSKKYNLIEFAPSLTKYLKSKEIFNYKSVDLFMESADIKADIMDLKQIDDNSIDCFLCSHVLEHVEDDKKALSELYRILKKDAWGIIMVPIPLSQKEIFEDSSIQIEEERWKYFGQNDHVRLYSKNGFIERIINSGFSLEELGVDFFSEYNFKKMGIDNKSILYVVKK